MDGLDPGVSPADGGAAAVPCVWVVASHRVLHDEHGRPQAYTLIDEAGSTAMLELGLQPLSAPRVPPARLPWMLSRVEGVLLGGPASHVDGRRFGEAPLHGEASGDAEREAVSLPLVRCCIGMGVPLIAFCRGAQEFNMALGGTLHQDLRSRPGGVAHWESATETLEQQYDLRHAVNTVAGGALARLTGCERFDVSSLHAQGVHTLAPGLVAEAHADDGLVEAFRWHGPGGFAWGFQFHPECGHRVHPPYARIMAAFANACRQRRAGSTRRAVPPRRVA